MGLRLSTPAADNGEGPPQPPQPSYWQMIKMGYNELVGAIIRPPRAEYLTAHLGPSTFEFCGRAFQRRDFEVLNERGQRLQCSHWEPVEYPMAEEEEANGAEGDGEEEEEEQQQQQQQRNPKEQRRGSLPCIVYMHGNSSARIEALPQLSLCLSLGITMVALDFAGSGRSEGEFVSLGYYEKDDLKAVIEHLRASERVSRIALWGRSMGAVTALMHGERDPSLAAMVRMDIQWGGVLGWLIACFVCAPCFPPLILLCLCVSSPPSSTRGRTANIVPPPPSFLTLPYPLSSPSTTTLLDPRLPLRRLRLARRRNGGQGERTRGTRPPTRQPPRSAFYQGLSANESWV
jgi:pimeloyl-ACP methyl ester carboxylesterase